MNLKFLTKLNVGNSFSRILFQSLLALLVRISAAFSGFLLNVVIVKSLQPSIAGELFILLSIVTGLGQISTLGFGNFILKYIGAAKGRGDYVLLNEFFSNALYLVVFVSVVVTIGLYFTSDYIVSILFDADFDVNLLHLISLTIPVITVLSIFMCSFQSVGKSVVGMFFQSVCQPLIFSLFCLLFVNNINDAVLVFLLSCFLTLPFVFIFWKKLDFTQFSKYKSNAFVIFRKNGLAFFLIILVGMLLNQAPILISAALVTSEEVALISIALKVSGLTSFVLVACNMVLSPHFSHLYNTGNIKQMAIYAKKGTAFMILIASPLLFVMIFYPEVILGMFGQEYIKASTILIVFSCSQFVNVATGSVGTLLIMTGCQKGFNRMQVLNLLTFISIVVIGTKIGIDLSTIAIAIFIGTGVQNIGSFILVKRHLGFYTLPVFSFK